MDLNDFRQIRKDDFHKFIVRALEEFQKGEDALWPTADKIFKRGLEDERQIPRDFVIKRRFSVDIIEEYSLSTYEGSTLIKYLDAALQHYQQNVKSVWDFVKENDNMGTHETISSISRFISSMNKISQSQEGSQ